MRGALLREHQPSGGLVGVSWEADMLPKALQARGAPYSLIPPSALWAQTEPLHKQNRAFAPDQESLTADFLSSISPQADGTAWAPMLSEPLPTATHIHLASRLTTIFR
uniref:Uncharacterized protein n=1 Tax=Eutreptiella gymnastica TaxID=73025 RepID=A0A7S1IR38_9EUGL